MHRRQPRYKRTATLFPYTPRFRSRSVGGGQRVHDGGPQRLGVRHAAFAGSETRVVRQIRPSDRSEEHTSELQSLMRISYAVFCLKKKKQKVQQTTVRRCNTHSKHKAPRLQCRTTSTIEGYI